MHKFQTRLKHYNGVSDSSGALAIFQDNRSSLGWFPVKSDTFGTVFNIGLVAKMASIECSKTTRFINYEYIFDFLPPEWPRSIS